MPVQPVNLVLMVPVVGKLMLNSKMPSRHLPRAPARFWGGKKGKEREGRTGRREGRGGNKRGKVDRKGQKRRV